ncbi:MAG: outer membrane protein assembly factor BamD [Pseudomonadota bacterium]
MRADIDDLESRVAHQEESLEKKVAKLDESLEKATKLLARNSADLGAEVQTLSSEMASLVGQIETLRREKEAAQAELASLREEYEKRLDVLEKAARAPATASSSAGSGTPAAATTAGETPFDKNAVFDAAYRKLQEGKYEEARRDFRLFLQRAAKDERADDAQYYVGQSYYLQKELEKSIAEFQRVIDAHRDGDMVDDAFYAAAVAAADMRWCTDARAYLGVLVQKYPDSPLVKPAKKKLYYLKKNAKNAEACQS